MEMKHEKDAEEYIALLREKYKVLVYDCFQEEDYFLTQLLFKVINIKPKSFTEKEKTLGLMLLEQTNLLKKVQKFMILV